MPDASIHTMVAFEGSSVILMARISGNDAAYLKQADVTGISYKTFNMANEAAAAEASGSLTISAVIFDTLQSSDARWTVDDDGYNFRYQVPASELADGDTTYRFELLFDPVLGEDFFVVYEVNTINVLTS